MPGRDAAAFLVGPINYRSTIEHGPADTLYGCGAHDAGVTVALEPPPGRVRLAPLSEQPEDIAGVRTG
ncbi:MULTISPECIES: hypothetical protein [Catenuloplanes]|uniref:Uncharacterized protein n=1 Tax=Catenuloplanes niger TaxID=587534 RepID=A0AAE3ZLA1_9ACTN|nr:hypothetical protein [Catenuloplanes niger]MDR7320739.1 hypothetical protein [Catenuloplanes niger]